MKFLANVKKGVGSDGSMDERIDEVLHAGKGEIKRHYAVDKRYYGTKEGVEAREQIEKEMSEKQQQHKKRKAKKKKQKPGASKTQAETGGPEAPSSRGGSDAGNSTIPNSVVTVAAVGALAAIVLLGGGGSRPS
mmetsp:Transcript_34443/g.79524  ORF Transcript_34443/g.79524 Transcript_34443/m.79524 type:complete len:134 (+) Transcript_34443:369-770(+)